MLIWASELGCLLRNMVCVIRGGSIGCVMSLKWSHCKMKCCQIVVFILEYPQYKLVSTSRATCGLLICPPQAQKLSVSYSVDSISYYGGWWV